MDTFCQNFNKIIVEEHLTLLNDLLLCTKKCEHLITNQFLWNLNFLYWAIRSETDNDHLETTLGKQLMKLISRKFKHAYGNEWDRYGNQIQLCRGYEEFGKYFWCCDPSCDSQTINNYNGDVVYEISDILLTKMEIEMIGGLFGVGTDEYEFVSYKYWHHFFNRADIVNNTVIEERLTLNQRLIKGTHYLTQRYKSNKRLQQYIQGLIYFEIPPDTDVRTFLKKILLDFHPDKKRETQYCTEILNAAKQLLNRDYFNWFQDEIYKIQPIYT